jgi:hypothetical protein
MSPQSGGELTQTRKLLAEQHERQTDLRQAWPSAWAAVEAKKARKWLR